MIEQTNKKQNKILTKTKNKTTKTQESYFWGAPWSDVAPGPLRDKKKLFIAVYDSHFCTHQKYIAPLDDEATPEIKRQLARNSLTRFLNFRKAKMTSSLWAQLQLNIHPESAATNPN